jgi:hypothetical protein
MWGRVVHPRYRAYSVFIERADLRRERPRGARDGDSLAGSGSRDRTCFCGFRDRRPCRMGHPGAEEPEGLEPSSSCLRGSCSAIELRLQEHRCCEHTTPEHARARIAPHERSDCPLRAHSSLRAIRVMETRIAMIDPVVFKRPRGAPDARNVEGRLGSSRAAFACVVERRARLPPQAKASRFWTGLEPSSMEGWKPLRFATKS